MEHLNRYIEALIFAADQPISLDEIKKSLENSFEVKIPVNEIEQAVEGLKEKYADEAFSFEIVSISKGFRFLTKPAFHNIIGNYLKQSSKKRMSKAALETLAIVAYKQPVTKSELEKVRGVNCDYSIQKLLDKDLVSITGRSDGPGRPLLYGTSEKFMDYFGINSLKDLPKLKDFKMPEDQIGGPARDEQL